MLHDFKLQDVSNDVNRRTQAQIIDLLRGAKFADDIFPDLKLEMFELDNTKIDILIIRNTNYKPYYLTEEKKFGKTSLSAGTIYTRTMDANTPKNRVASSMSIEKMWKERFGLNQTPQARFKIYLCDAINWKHASRFSSVSRVEFFYQLFPEFTIQRTDVDHGIEDHNLEWARGEIGYHYNKFANNSTVLELCYHNTPLTFVTLATFDAGKKTIVAPDWHQIGRGRFYCYLEDSLEYIYQYYFLVGHQHHKDDSLQLSYSFDSHLSDTRNGFFDIPVLKNKQDLLRFTDFAQKELKIQPFNPSMMPFFDEKAQNEFFYSLLECYKIYKELVQS